MCLEKDRLKVFQKAKQQVMCSSCIENINVRNDDAMQTGGFGGGLVNQTGQLIDVINLDDEDDGHIKGEENIVAANKVVGNDYSTNFNNRDICSNTATASDTSF